MFEVRGKNNRGPLQPLAKTVARRGQTHTAPMTVKDRCTQPVLKPLDAPTDGRLLKTQFGCCSPEAPLFGGHQGTALTTKIKRHVRNSKVVSKAFIHRQRRCEPDKDCVSRAAMIA
jgi:hypothetical protein